MFFKEHCRRCKEILGDEYQEIHHWLDEFAWQYKIGHRKLRHHRAGIKLVRKCWGNSAAKAAKLHILDDIREIENEGADEYSIPDDRDDYVRRKYAGWSMEPLDDDERIS
jgi:hypothetical protein